MNTMELIRAKSPLIHHLTNQVVMNFTANGLLACGGSPIMAKEALEMNDMARIVDGVLINIGTLTEPELRSMIIAGKFANQRGIPVVLDPVGAAATIFRGDAVNTLLEQVKFTAIKGNAGEMAHLVGIALKTKGVDSSDVDEAILIDVAKAVAKKYKTMAIVTGETDVICHKGEVRTNKTGHIFLTQITGAGCLLGSLITASLTIDTKPLQAAHDLVAFYGKAAEVAVKNTAVQGTGTFIPYFLDALAKV